MVDRRRFVRAGALLAVSRVGLGQRSRAGGEVEGAKMLPPSVMALQNRRGEVTPITVAEREGRVERAREMMRREKVDAVLMAGGTSLVYFTGIRWGNSERMLCYVLPVKGDAFLVCPGFEEERMRERLGSGPGGAKVRVYAWQEDESPYALVRKGLIESGVASGTLGVEERTPFVFVSEIGKACPAMKVVDGTAVVAGCRMIKSAAELGLMRFACDVTLTVYKACWMAGHPGMTTAEFSSLVGAAYERVGFAGDASCQTGAYSALPHGSVAPQVIRENEIVLIDDGCTVEGYQSDLSRTFVYGKATDRMLRVFDVVHKAQAAALAAARPGVECQAVDAAARKVVTDAGFGPDYTTFSHRVGHGIGMDGHEWTYLVRGNRTLLQPGMTFSDEPGIYLKGEFGIRLEDDMAIGQGGAEMMTRTSGSLEHPFA